jgi:cobalt-zinc-cadmium efflux system outer membrane protein
MRLRLAAKAALVVSLFVAWPTTAADNLTLGDAIARVAANHPRLRLLDAQGELFAAERDRAALRPPMTVGVELENALGSGAYEGIDGAELTVTLASVLERGGKLDARRVLAQARIDALAVERETQRLDLLAEVARRFLALDAAGHLRDIAAADVAQRRRTVDAARTRLAAGASPESVVLGAEAALAGAELQRSRMEGAWQFARQQLAALWGEREPDFQIQAADPLALPDVGNVGALAALLEATPELSRFADERRLREARLQLARSAATTDVEWQAGVRRHEPGNDIALVAGISVPLGSRQRAEPGIRAAGADLAQLSIEREAAGLALYTTLIEAHGRYALARQEVRELGDAVIPLLERAVSAAERAYRAGAISYLDWAQLQSELSASRRQQLEVAADGQRALIELQRLTGQPMLARSTTGDLP